MKILLDTCTLLWMVFDPDQLTPQGRLLLNGPHHTISVAAATFWEIAIKVGNGKLRLTAPVVDLVERIRKAGLRIVPTDEKIWIRSAEIDWPHRDPADRLIVATAERENLTIMTCDRIIRDFFPATIW